MKRHKPSPGMIYSSKDGWIAKPATTSPSTMHDRDVAYSVAGLGAFNKYRSHPGRQFPNRALTVKLGDKGKQNVHLSRAFGKGSARPLHTAHISNRL